jgi:hypothetical protein
MSAQNFQPTPSLSNFNGVIFSSQTAANNTVSMGIIPVKNGNKQEILTYINSYLTNITNNSTLVNYNPYSSFSVQQILYTGQEFFNIFATTLTTCTVQGQLMSTNGKNILELAFQVCKNNVTNVESSKLYSFSCFFESRSNFSNDFPVQVPLFIGSKVVSITYLLRAKIITSSKGIGQTPDSLAKLVLGFTSCSNRLPVSIVVVLQVIDASLRNYIPVCSPCGTINANRAFINVRNDAVLIANQCGAFGLTFSCVNNFNVLSNAVQILYGGTYTSKNLPTLPKKEKAP